MKRQPHLQLKVILHAVYFFEESYAYIYNVMNSITIMIQEIQLRLNLDHKISCVFVR